VIFNLGFIFPIQVSESRALTHDGVYIVPTVVHLARGAKETVQKSSERRRGEDFSRFYMCV
jgi:hypothetical protein